MGTAAVWAPAGTPLLPPLSIAALCNHFGWRYAILRGDGGFGFAVTELWGQLGLWHCPIAFPWVEETLLAGKEGREKAEQLPSLCLVAFMPRANWDEIPHGTEGASENRAPPWPRDTFQDVPRADGGLVLPAVLPFILHQLLPLLCIPMGTSLKGWGSESRAVPAAELDLRSSRANGGQIS